MAWVPCIDEDQAENRHGSIEIVASVSPLFSKRPLVPEVVSIRMAKCLSAVGINPVSLSGGFEPRRVSMATTMSGVYAVSSTLRPVILDVVSPRFALTLLQ
jgi:hypothetical protein